MRGKKKLWLQLLFLAVVMALTLTAVFWGQDPKELLACIRGASPPYLALSLLFVAVFIFGESYIIRYLLRTWGIRIPPGRCYLYSGVGFFFSCITPSATGGQPAQIHYMRKDGIPIPVATVILMIVTITYKLVLVVVGAFVLLVRPASVMARLAPVLFWCWLGLGLNIFCVVLMCFLVFHPLLAERMVTALFRVLERIRLLKPSRTREEKSSNAMEQYRQTAAFLAAHRMVIWNVFLITVVQRFLLFSVTALTYYAFGCKGERLMDLLLLSAMISVSVDMLPLPGGMGISEGLFYRMFLPVFGKALVIPAMVVSRGISYYAQLLLGAFLTVLAALGLGRRSLQRKE